MEKVAQHRSGADFYIGIDEEGRTLYNITTGGEPKGGYYGKEKLLNKWRLPDLFQPQVNDIRVGDEFTVNEAFSSVKPGEPIVITDIEIYCNNRITGHKFSFDINSPLHRSMTAQHRRYVEVSDPGQRMHYLVFGPKVSGLATAVGNYFAAENSISIAQAVLDLKKAYDRYKNQ